MMRFLDLTAIQRNRLARAFFLYAEERGDDVSPLREIRVEDGDEWILLRVLDGRVEVLDAKDGLSDD